MNLAGINQKSCYLQKLTFGSARQPGERHSDCTHPYILLLARLTPTLSPLLIKESKTKLTTCSYDVLTNFELYNIYQ